MANTGFVWGAWAQLDAQATLTQGGTTTQTGAELNISGKAAAQVGLILSYSNHAKATAGLTVYLLQEVNGTYQVIGDVPLSLGEMTFIQNTAVTPTPFAIDPRQVAKFKVYLNWGNTTASSAVTVTVYQRTADIPVAS